MSHHLFLTFSTASLLVVHIVTCSFMLNRNERERGLVYLLPDRTGPFSNILNYSLLALGKKSAIDFRHSSYSYVRQAALRWQFIVRSGARSQVRETDDALFSFFYCISEWAGWHLGDTSMSWGPLYDNDDALKEEREREEEKNPPLTENDSVGAKKQQLRNTFLTAD